MKKKSQSALASELSILPVGRIRRLLQRGCHDRKVTSKAALVYTSALEYAISEVIRQAADNAEKDRRIRINSRDIFLVPAADDVDFHTLLKGGVFPDAGVVKTFSFIRRKK